MQTKSSYQFSKTTYILLISLVIIPFSYAHGGSFYQYEVDGKIVYSDKPPQDKKFTSFEPKEVYVVSHQPSSSRSRWKVVPNTEEQVEPIVHRVSRQHGVSSRLIRSVIKAESNYNPNAISRKGAQGLMQIMPETAKYLGLENPFDPEENIEAGVRYLKKLLDHFQGNTTLALAAYNAGLSNVEKYQGVPPFPETQEYVKKIKNYYSQL